MDHGFRLSLALVLVLSLFIAREAQSADSLGARWRVPWYRDAVYVSQRIASSELLVTVDGDPQALAKWGLYAEVVGDRAGVYWQEFRRMKARAVERENVFGLDVSCMAYGEHVVRLALFTRDDQRLLSESRISFRKLAPAPVEVCPDIDGRLLVNAVPIFVVGIATPNCEGTMLARFAAAGLNVVIATTPGVPSDVRKLLDAARVQRMLAVLPFPSEKPVGERTQSPLLTYETETALLAWHSGTTQPTPERMYREFAERSVYRPLISMGDVRSSLTTQADIVVAAPSISKGKTVLEPEALVSWGAAIAKRTARGQPTWAMVSLSSDQERGTPGTLRLLTWLAVTVGAQGVVFGDSGKGTSAESDDPAWRSMSGVSKELRQVRSALAEGTDRPVVLDSPVSLRARAVYHESRWLIIAVNPTGKPVNASMSVPGMCTGAHLRVLGETRGITTASSSESPTGHAIIADAFLPYQAHVYTNVRGATE